MSTTGIDTNAAYDTLASRADEAYDNVQRRLQTLNPLDSGEMRELIELENEMNGSQFAADQLFKIEHGLAKSLLSNA